MGTQIRTAFLPPFRFAVTLGTQIRKAVSCSYNDSMHPLPCTGLSKLEHAEVALAKRAKYELRW